MGVITIPFLNYEKRMELGKRRGYLGTVMLAWLLPWPGHPA